MFLNSQSPEDDRRSSTERNPTVQFPLASDENLQLLEDEGYGNNIYNETGETIKPTKIEPDVYFAFFMIGVSCLAPYFVFMVTLSFLTPLIKRDDALKSTPNIIITCSTLTSFIAQALLSRRSLKIEPRKTIAGTLLFIVIIFIIMGIFSLISAMPTRVYFTFLVVFNILTSLAGAAMQFVSFKLTAAYGIFYSQAINTGQGISGIFPPLVQFISIASSGKSPDDLEMFDGQAVMIFFLVSAIIVFGSFLSQRPLNRGRGELREDNSASNLYSGAGVLQPSQNYWSWNALKKLGALGFAISFVFIVTLSIFPVVTSTVCPVSKTYSRYFVPAHIMAFNLADLTGRALVSLRRLRCTNVTHLAIASISRLGFMLAFALCNVGCKGAIIPSDAFFFLVIILFGISNGWVTSCCFLAVPGKVKDGIDESMGLMSVLLCFGLVIGSAISFIISEILDV